MSELPAFVAIPAREAQALAQGRLAHLRRLRRGALLHRPPRAGDTPDDRRRRASPGQCALGEAQSLLEVIPASGPAHGILFDWVRFRRSLEQHDHTEDDDTEYQKQKRE